MSETLAVNGLEQLATLAGYTIGVTASRRREELQSAFERRGARVIVGSTLRIHPIEDDREVLKSSLQCIASGINYVIATTGLGFRSWIQAADGWGFGDELRAALRNAQILTRGPKARGAVRAAGLSESWTAPSESLEEVVEYLLSQGVSQRLIAVQLHGEPCTEALDRLRRAGAQIIPIALYRWAPPSDIGAALKLINSICDAQLEAVTFTSAPAVVGLVELASHAGVQEQMIKMLKTKVLACCVGPVCAAPLERHGITALVPPRARLGHLIRLVSEAVPAYHSRVLKYNGGSLEIRGHGLMLDNTFISIPSAPLEVLKTLAQQPGRIITKAELMAALGIADPSSHAVEIAITRLRSYLPEPRLVQTVTKRGYRLATISRSGNEALEESP